jgi:SAM-dependent methyltransferase
MQWFAAQGYPVLGVDRNAEALATACQYGEVLQADLEDGSPWPLPGRQFGAVVVTNYLWRVVFPSLFDSVQPGGVLLYETFAVGNETVGRPSNPEFLLQPGELLQRVAAAGPQWRVIAYEDGFEADPERFVQRIAAVRTVTTDAEAPTRYPLQSGLL